MLGFKKKESYGLQILDREIRVVKVRPRAKGVDLQFYHSEPLPQGAIRNGKILDEESLFALVSVMASRLGIEGAGIHLSIPSSSAVLRRSVFPALGDKELRNMIDIELNGGSQMTFKDPVFDFVRLGSPATSEGNKAGKKQQEVLIFVCPSNVVEDYVRIVEKAGMTALSVELAPLATLRLLMEYAKSSKQKLTERMIVINADSAHLEFGIFIKGVPVFLHSVPEVSAGAEYGKTLATELNRILYYFTYSVSQSQEDIQQVYLFGADEALLPELSQSVKQSFDGPVVAIPLDSWLEEEDGTIQYFAVPIGLALKGA